MININNINTISAEYGHKSLTVSRDYGDGDNFFDKFVGEGFSEVDYKTVDSLIDRFGGTCYLSFYDGDECRLVLFYRCYSLQCINII